LGLARLATTAGPTTKEEEKKMKSKVWVVFSVDDPQIFDLMSAFDSEEKANAFLAEIRQGQVEQESSPQCPDAGMMGEFVVVELEVN
jgi:hypothetical protein